MTGSPTVVVTGGSGLLGSRLIERLRRSYQVVSLDLRGDPNSPVDVEFISTDLTSDASVGRAVERIRRQYGNEVASIVHLAAYYDFAGRPSPLYQKVTVEGTKRLLSAFEPLDVGQFVFSSTMLVHEPADDVGERIEETDPLEPSWAYPASKVETEALIRKCHGEVPVAILRIAGVYDEEGHSPPLTNQIRRIHGKWLTSHFYPGDPARGQGFVHTDDVVQALVRTVERRQVLPPEVELLVGEPETLGYGELQDRIGRAIHGRPWRTWPMPKPLAKVGAWLREKNPFGEEPFIHPWMVDRADDQYALDIDRAREAIGWSPEHRLGDVLPQMVAQMKKDPRRWYGENKLKPPRRAAA